MQNRLKTHYRVKKAIVLSNVALFPLSEQANNRTELKTIGFLSNLTFEKGSYIVIKLAEALKKIKLPIKVFVAGPCHDEKLKSELLKAETEGIIKWFGAVHGGKKKQFLAEIDTFVFPTLNEAEPLVLWEALAAGVPVIAYSRGCIMEQVKEAGVVIPTDQNFIDIALPVLETWMRNQELYQELLFAIRQYYVEIKNQQASSWENFKKFLSKTSD